MIFNENLAPLTLLCTARCLYLQTREMCEENDPEPEPEPEPGYRAAQLLSSIDGGDVLPEADIVANIVDKLER